jgi:para-nitrobenzyl esterase
MDRRSFLGVGLGVGAKISGILLTGGLRSALTAAVEGSPGDVVDTTAGKIRGLKQAGVLAFRGVPYGASAAGSSRFMPPSKPQPWTRVRDTFELGPRCPQVSGGLIPEVAAVDRSEGMGEDCLVLNLWTPSAGREHKRPVMVWLHGGAYSVGSAGFTIYDGANLARKHNVVLVGINHRLNVFGFLYLAEIGGEKYARSSNVGMLDIVAALEWVRDNIATFGGDPKNVTIFGQSGGAGKVSTLMAMPSAKGLFHRAIIESRPGAKGVPRGEASEAAQQYLSRLGLKPNQIDQAQKLPKEQLVEAMGAGGLAGNTTLRLEPTIDGHLLSSDLLDPKTTQLSPDIPLIAGSVETEVAFFPNQQLDPIDDATLHQKAKQILAKADDAQVDRLIAAYRKGRPNISNTDLFLVIASDASFRKSVITEAENKSANGKAPVFQYYFTWRSPVRDGKLRSFHTLEIPFVFENLEAGASMTGSGADRNALSERMSSAWVAFARTGNPNHAGLPHWPAFNNDERATMIFNQECRVVNDPNGDERKMLYSLLANG